MHGSPLFETLQLEGREVFRFSRHLMHLGPRVLNPQYKCKKEYKKNKKNLKQKSFFPTKLNVKTSRKTTSSVPVYKKFLYGNKKLPYWARIFFHEELNTLELHFLRSFATKMLKAQATFVVSIFHGKRGAA